MNNNIFKQYTVVLFITWGIDWERTKLIAETTAGLKVHSINKLKNRKIKMKKNA